MIFYDKDGTLGSLDILVPFRRIESKIQKEKTMVLPGPLSALWLQYVSSYVSMKLFAANKLDFIKAQLDYYFGQSIETAKTGEPSKEYVGGGYLCDYRHSQEVFQAITNQGIFGINPALLLKLNLTVYATYPFVKIRILAKEPKELSLDFCGKTFVIPKQAIKKIIINKPTIFGGLLGNPISFICDSENAPEGITFWAMRNNDITEISTALS